MLVRTGMQPLLGRATANGEFRLDFVLADVEKVRGGHSGSRT